MMNDLVKNVKNERRNEEILQTNYVFINSWEYFIVDLIILSKTLGKTTVLFIGSLEYSLVVCKSTRYLKHFHIQSK